MTPPTRRSYPLTRADKHSLAIDAPVMNAAGILGYGDEYAGLIDLDKLGAFVTNPITWQSRSPANGTRVVPLAGGALVHTGLPGAGLHKVCMAWRNTWDRLGIPVLVHVIAKTTDDARACLERLENEHAVAGVEFGLSDDDTPEAAAALIKAAADRAEKPLIARLPFGASVEYAQRMVDAGAGGVTVCAPPRGTARDGAGRWVGGRVYGASIHPLVLRQVGQMTRALEVPVIAAGGIDEPRRAREYLDAGAAAVQFDAIAWHDPAQVNWITRDLRGGIVTEPVEAAAGWHPRLGETDRAQQIAQQPTRPDPHTNP